VLVNTERVRNSEIADTLSALGTLYEIDGADRFRVLAYKEAAKAARSAPVSLEQMAKDGRLTEIDGIGKTLETKIVDLVETGEIPALVKLHAKYPPTLVEVTRLPGLGAKTVRRLYDELGITDLDSLRTAAEKEEISGLKGLGKKVEENVLKGLAGLGDDAPAERVLLSDALPYAEQLAADLKEHPAAIDVVPAGSLRRWGETCKDVDLIATTTDGEALGKALLEHPLVDEKRKAGDWGASAVLHTGLKVDLRVTSPETFGNLLQHFTGSMEHNVQLRERALKKGLSVSEHGIAELDDKKKPTGKVHKHKDEAGVYRKLGLRYIEPELRQGTGEIEAASKKAGAVGSLPKLIEISDLKGDLHTHTTLSDGKNTLEEMADAARKRGYAYYAITDHSASHGFGDHVTDEMLEERIAEIAAWNKGPGTKAGGGKKFRLLAGSEVNIGTKGELDYPDELLAQLDWVVASVHTSFQVSPKQMTERVIEAINHPLVDCIGHLTGRLIGRREPYDIDVEKIVAAAAANGTMIEINGNPNRRDLSERHARLAKEAGVIIAVNTDAHQIATLDNMRYGIATARRAWLTAADVANTRGWREFSKLRKRTKAK
jgi:DNA polymerase (family 10)